MSEDVILIAGTTVEHQLANGTWKRAPRLTSIGVVGEMAEPKEKTTLEDTSKVYGSGLQDAADKTFNGQYIPPQEVDTEHYADYLLQQEFITRCRNKEEFNMRVNWPDGEVSGFLTKTLGFQFTEMTQEDWKMFTVNAKQNSTVVYGVTLSGTATVAVSATITPTLATVPAVMSDKQRGTITWTSSDPSKATVDEDGVVTGVAAGATVITAEIRGVIGSLAVTVTA